MSIAFAQMAKRHTALGYNLRGGEVFKCSDSYSTGRAARRDYITLTGEVETRIIPVDFAPGSHEIVAGKPWNRPVSGTVELLVNKTAAATEQIPIDDVYNAENGQPVPIGEATFYTRFVNEISVPEGSELSLRVTVLDNFGIEHLQDIPVSE